MYLTMDIIIICLKNSFFFIAKNVLYYNIYYVCSLSNNYFCRYFSFNVKHSLIEYSYVNTS